MARTTATTRTAVPTVQNLFTYSDSDSLARYGANSGVTVDVYNWEIFSLANKTIFGDNSVARYAYKTNTALKGVTYCFSVFVKMDDGSAPVANSAASSTSDLLLVGQGAQLNNCKVELVSGTIYRVSNTFVGTGVAGNCGAIKYTAQSSKTFIVTGYQLVQANYAGPYAPTTTTAVDTGAIRSIAPTVQNLLLYSQDVSNASWGKTNVTVTSDTITAPDGTLTADKIEATAAAATTMIQDVASAGAPLITFSVYAKKGTGATVANTFVLRNQTTATTLLNILFNYDTGAITYTTGTAGVSAEDVGGGWWKISLTVSSGFSINNTVRVYSCFRGDVMAAGDYAYVWGAQLVQANCPGSYAPTTTTAVNTGAIRSIAPTVQNLLTYSNDFSNAAWPTTNWVVTANDTTAPDETLTADRLTATATPASLVRQITATSAVPHTYSIDVKIGTDLNPTFLLRNNTTSTALSNRSYTEGVGSTAEAYGTSSMIDKGGGWYRISLTATSGIKVGDILGLYFGDTGGTTNGQYFWLANGQLVQANLDGPIAPTTTTAINTGAIRSIVT